jgi:putative ABC transport system permease protein
MPLRLLWRNLLAHPFRALLTFGSVAVAMFLLAFLYAVSRGFTAAVDMAAQNRLVVQSAVSLFVQLPQSYEAKIAQVDGVETVCKFQWFGGRYKGGEEDEGGFFAQFAVDMEPFRRTYPEVELVEGSWDDFAARRTGCVVGKALARQLDLRIGSRMPILGTIFPRADGSAWDFEVVALYESRSPNFDQMTMFFHYAYLRESIDQGGALGGDGVGVYMIKVAPGTAPEQVQSGVDDLFRNGPQRVQTTTEAEFNRQFVSMMGNVPLMLRAIGGGVLFAIFFAVLNTMLMAGRERTRDAGIMKALGFRDRTIAGLLLLESVALSLGGAGLGALLAKAIEGPFRGVISQWAPGFAIDADVLLRGFLIAVTVGVLSGLLPGLRLGRMRPVLALRTEA